MVAPGEEVGVARRRPRRVYEVGREPDPRFSLANERTLLAWLRTALALVVAGVAIVAFADAFRETAWFEVTAGIAFAGGAVAALLGYLRWQQVERALRLDEPMPSAVASTVVLAAILGIAVVSGYALIASTP